MTLNAAPDISFFIPQFQLLHPLHTATLHIALSTVQPSGNVFDHSWNAVSRALVLDIPMPALQAASPTLRHLLALKQWSERSGIVARVIRSAVHDFHLTILAQRHQLTRRSGRGTLLGMTRACHIGIGHQHSTDRAVISRSNRSVFDVRPGQSSGIVQVDFSIPRELLPARGGSILP